MLTSHGPRHPDSLTEAPTQTITVYTTGPACMRCTLTKRVLAKNGVGFVEVDIRDDDAAREYVTDELGYTEAPVVVVSDEDHWSGFRPDRLEALASGLGMLR